MSKFFNVQAAVARGEMRVSRCADAGWYQVGRRIDREWTAAGLTHLLIEFTWPRSTTRLAYSGAANRQQQSVGVPSHCR